MFQHWLLFFSCYFYAWFIFRMDLFAYYSFFFFFFFFDLQMMAVVVWYSNNSHHEIQQIVKLSRSEIIWKYISLSFFLYVYWINQCPLKFHPIWCLDRSQCFDVWLFFLLFRIRFTETGTNLGLIEVTPFSDYSHVHIWINYIIRIMLSVAVSVR